MGISAKSLTSLTSPTAPNHRWAEACGGLRGGSKKAYEINVKLHLAAEEIGLTLYGETCALAVVSLDPIRAIALAGELIGAALPKLA